MSSTDGRALGELFSGLSREVGGLIRAEIALARVELRAAASVTRGRVATFVLGALVACAGFYAVVAGLVLAAIAAGMAPWAAALAVGGVVLVIGWIMAKRALQKLLQIDVTPHETVRTLKENANGSSTSPRSDFLRDRRDAPKADADRTRARTAAAFSAARLRRR